MGIRVPMRANRPFSAVFSKASVLALAFTAVGVSAFGQIQSGSSYTIVNRATAQAIDDPSGSKTAGQRQQEWACNGNAQQNWTFTSVGSGYYTIVNTVSGLALDTNGSEIVQNPKNGGTTQNWLPTFIGGGFYEITNESSGEVLDVPSGNTSNGTLLDQTTNGDYLYQQWYVTTAGLCRTGQFSSSSNGWAAVSIPAPGSGQSSNLLALFGTITMTNSTGGFAEDLFGVGWVPNGTSCANTNGGLPPSSWNYIIKSVTSQTITVPISYWPWKALSGLGVQAPSGSSNCMFFGADGTNAYTVNIAALTVPETTSNLQDVGLGGEGCFNTGGCQIGNLNPETQSFETVYNISQAGTLDFIWGNVSDATLSAPSGTWVANTDLYVFHSGSCPANGFTTWNWTTQSIPGNANLLMDLEESGVGSGVGQQGVFQSLNFPLNAGDCLVMLTGVPVDPGKAALDNEIQIYAVITP